MSRRALAATLMMIGLGSFCLLPFSGTSSDAQIVPSTSNPVGRFQITGVNQDVVIMVDTTNGRCWRAHTNFPRIQWTEISSPLDRPDAK